MLIVCFTSTIQTQKCNFFQNFSLVGTAFSLPKAVWMLWNYRNGVIHGYDGDAMESGFEEQLFSPEAH